MAIHQPRDDRRAARVDHLAPGRALALLAGWPDPADPAVLGQQADTHPQPGGAAISQRRVTVQDAAHSVTVGQRSRPHSCDQKPRLGPARQGSMPRAAVPSHSQGNNPDRTAAGPGDPALNPGLDGPDEPARCHALWDCAALGTPGASTDAGGPRPGP
jgi:hypothetical protein